MAEWLITEWYAPRWRFMTVVTFFFAAGYAVGWMING